MGSRGPLDSHGQITHGICPTCLAGQSWKDSPVLVVSRSREDLVPLLEDALRGLPAVRIVVDRRSADRRRRVAPDVDYDDRRSGRDRRRGADALLS